MMEPQDQIATGVPIQFADTDGSTAMRDLTREGPTGQATSTVEEEAPDTASGAGPAQQIDRPNKRDRSEDSPDLISKRSHCRGTKRDRDSDGEGQVTRRRWRELVGQSNNHPSDTDLDLSSDEDVRQVTEGDRDPDNEKVIVLVPDGAQLPIKGKDGSWDLAANQSLTLQPGRTTWINTGLRMSLPQKFSLVLLSQPRLAEQNIMVSPSLVKSDESGIIRVLLQNSSPVPRRIQKGERICKGVVIHTPDVEWQRVATLPYERQENVSDRADSEPYQSSI